MFRTPKNATTTTTTATYTRPTKNVETLVDLMKAAENEDSYSPDRINWVVDTDNQELVDRLEKELNEFEELLNNNYFNTGMYTDMGAMMMGYKISVMRMLLDRVNF